MKRPEPSHSGKITDRWKMNRKALFFDIDGTLLSEYTKEIPGSAVMALRKAREAGHIVFINSGRTRCLMKEIERDIPVDGYLCGCGTYIDIEGRVALHQLIGSERRFELQNLILEHRLDGILEGADGCYVQAGVSHMEQIEHVKRVVEKSGVLFQADWTKDRVPFDKFCVLADEHSDIDGFLKALDPDISAIDRGRGLYECVPSGFNKATAMEFILNHYQIPWEESYAFGDSTNDLAMMKYACNSVVMGKHHKALEEYATFITKTVEDHGIAYAFEQLNII